MGSAHLDFERAPEHRRWAGRPLTELFATLKREGAQAKGEWVWRVLPRGAVVAMRVRGDLRFELRIARRSGPTTERDRRAWVTEIDTFLRAFGCEHWRREEEAGAVVRFIETEPASQAEPQEQTGDLFGRRDEIKRAPSAIAGGH